MITRSFIDLLFILLCSTIVLLSESVQLRALDAQPAKVGGGGISAISAGELILATVSEGQLHRDGKPVDARALAAEAGDSGRTVVLVPTDATVSHQRVMDVWSSLRLGGAAVQLGVKPADG